MNVLMCGSRSWDRPLLIDVVVAGLVAVHKDVTVVHGGAKGADQMAGDAARRYGAGVIAVPARWDVHDRSGPVPCLCDPGVVTCRAAGPRRTRECGVHALGPRSTR